MFQRSIVGIPEPAGLDQITAEKLQVKKDNVIDITLQTSIWTKIYEFVSKTQFLCRPSFLFNLNCV